MSKCTLDKFEYNDIIYTQYLDLNNDSVYIENENENKIYEFDYSTNVYEIKNNIRGLKIGLIRLLDDFWVFNDFKTKETIVSKYGINDMDGILKFECELAKMLLKREYEI